MAAALAGIVWFGLILSACTPQEPTGPTSVSQQQSTVVYVIIAPSPSPSAPPNCEAGSVAVQSSLGNTWNTNQESLLSASVLGKDGKALPSECGSVTVGFNLEDAPAPKAQCTLVGGEAPALRCSTAGNAKVRASSGAAEGFANFIIKSN